MTNQPISTESFLTALWCKLLHLDTIQPDAGFLSLGGNSLKAMRMAREIREAMQIQVPLNWLVGDFSVRTLAARLDASLSETVQYASPQREFGEI